MENGESTFRVHANANAGVRLALDVHGVQWLLLISWWGILDDARLSWRLRGTRRNGY